MIRFAAACLMLLPLPLRAQSPIAEVVCAPTQQMTQKLSRQYGGSRRATGLRAPEELVEIWANEGGDWTMVITYASGRSCIVAMGEHWTAEGPPA